MKPVLPILSVMLVSAAGCSASSRGEGGSVSGPALLRADEVLWAVQTVGPVVQIAALPDGGSAVLRGGTSTPGVPLALESRGADGAGRWKHDLGEGGMTPTCADGRMALGPDGTMFVLYGISTGMSCGGMARRLAAIGLDGVVAWDVPVAEDAFLTDVAVHDGVPLVTLTTLGSDGMAATTSMRSYGPDGSLSGEQQLATSDGPPWPLARLDASGGVLVASGPRLERRSAGGALLWAHEVPQAWFQDALVTPEGRILVTGWQEGDFTWGGIPFHSDVAFDPTQFHAVLSPDGEVLWSLEDARPLGVGTGGRVYASRQRGACASIQAYDAEGALLWERIPGQRLGPAAPFPDMCAFRVLYVEAAGGTIRVGGYNASPFMGSGTAILLGDTELTDGLGFAGAFREPELGQD